MGGKSKTNEDEVEHNNQPNEQTNKQTDKQRTTTDKRATNGYCYYYYCYYYGIGGT